MVRGHFLRAGEAPSRAAPSGAAVQLPQSGKRGLADRAAETVALAHNSAAMTRVLSFHASYGCKHRGRCCTSGWPIAVESAERTRIEDAIEAGLLEVRNVATAAGPPLLAVIDGRCVFHDDNANGGCRIHRAIGHTALPLACRQFPRQSLRDPRGVSVTLSHYCPTANDLLLTATGPATIVENAPAFPAGAEYVGLTAD